MPLRGNGWKLPSRLLTPKDVTVKLIKTVHTIVFIVLSFANLVILYSAIIGRFDVITGVAFILILIEGIFLMTNDWKCPLTVYTEKLGAFNGRVTDMFMPKGFADRVFPICFGIFIFSLLVFAIRYAGSTMGLF